MQNETDKVQEKNDQNTKRKEISFLGFQLRGLIFPCFRLSFYRRAIQKHPFWTIAFFAIFGVLSSAIVAIDLMSASSASKQEIIDGYDAGISPTVLIENGIVSVEGQQPWISEEGEVVYIIDTSGKITRIDDRKYENGILLTKNEIHLLWSGDYTIEDAKNLNELFGDPIVIDKQFILIQWNILNLIFGLIVFCIFFVWLVIFRFMYFLGIALIGWGIVYIFKKDVQFNTILIVGLLANVPAVYINTILIKSGKFFFPMHLLLLVGIWAIVLILVLNGLNEKAIRISA